MPPRHPDIAQALGRVREVLAQTRAAHGLSARQPLCLLVACSGGRDSVALLGLLALLVEADRLTLQVGHVDHGLRADSATEAEHVLALAASLGIEAQVRRLELDPQAPGLPARARDARHAVLQALAERAGAHRIALAHSATDQAETVLLNLARGAGLRGLAGMQPVEPDAPRIRPLLGVPRGRMATLCAHLGLAFIDDPTNLDEDHPRVRVRNVVLPALAQGRGGIEAAMAASAVAAREAAEALYVLAQEELAARRISRSRHRTTGWGTRPRALRIQVLRGVMADAGIGADLVGRRALDAIDRGLCAGGAKRWDLARGHTLHVRDGVLWVARSGSGGTPPDLAS
ncbi:MAG: tRNA lysidine(34) synthetase TilS [Myxococcota bacterium]